MDAVLCWIVGSGVLMGAIAMVGSVTLLLNERALKRVLLHLVAFAAGSLIAGAFFHMLPVGTDAGDCCCRVFTRAFRICLARGP